MFLSISSETHSMLFLRPSGLGFYLRVFSSPLIQLQRRRQHIRSRMLCSAVEADMRLSGFNRSCVAQLTYTAEAPWELVTPHKDLSLAALPKRDVDANVLFSDSLCLIHSYDGYTAVYTDGSKSANGAGSAFVTGNTCRSLSLPSSASIFTAELYAILLALIFFVYPHSHLHRF